MGNGVRQIVCLGSTLLLLAIHAAATPIPSTGIAYGGSIVMFPRNATTNSRNSSHAAAEVIVRDPCGKVIAQRIRQFCGNATTIGLFHVGNAFDQLRHCSNNTDTCGTESSPALNWLRNADFSILATADSRRWQLVRTALTTLSDFVRLMMSFMILSMASWDAETGDLDTIAGKLGYADFRDIDDQAARMTKYMDKRNKMWKQLTTCTAEHSAYGTKQTTEDSTDVNEYIKTFPDSGWRDEKGLSCQEWLGKDRDCDKATFLFDYSPEGQRELLDNCAAACSYTNARYEKEFVDEKGNRCMAWRNFNCDEAEEKFHYSADGAAAVRETCVLACKHTALYEQARNVDEFAIIPAYGETAPEVWNRQVIFTNAKNAPQCRSIAQDYMVLLTRDYPTHAKESAIVDKVKMVILSDHPNAASSSGWLMDDREVDALSNDTSWKKLAKTYKSTATRSRVWPRTLLISLAVCVFIMDFTMELMEGMWMRNVMPVATYCSRPGEWVQITHSICLFRGDQADSLGMLGLTCDGCQWSPDLPADCPFCDPSPVQHSAIFHNSAFRHDSSVAATFYETFLGKNIYGVNTETLKMRNTGAEFEFGVPGAD